MISLFLPRRARAWNEQDQLRVGVVVIGRNEGERLAACLSSIPEDLPLVYVDSGSTDQSVALARQCGATVLELDMAIPFTAARARNAGFAALLKEHPDREVVQFVDGDMILQRGWLPYATGFLSQQTDVAVVAGRNRERFPDQSRYNALCDIEWNTPVGEAKAVGGAAMYLVSAFRDVGGFDPEISAGEEPELCLRLRRAGQRIFRLPHEMTLHDAAIRSFGQWWKRATRSGYAYALGALRHGFSADRYRVREVVRALLWGGLLPGAALLGLSAVIAEPYTERLPEEARMVGAAVMGLVALVYLLKLVRLSQRFRGEVNKPLRYAGFLMVANMAEALGVLKGLGERLIGATPRMIEYK